MADVFAGTALRPPLALTLDALVEGFAMRPSAPHTVQAGPERSAVLTSASMGDPAKRRANYEDVLAAPRHVIAEVVGGVLHTQPRPAVPHARASSQLGAELSGPFGRGRGGPGGWVLLDEPELHLGPEPDIVVPDLAGWRRERMPRIPMQAVFIALAPDWICEVVSPSTQAFDRGEKMDVYARERVRHAWLVDPLAQLLEAWRLEGERWLRLGNWRGDARVGAEPFDAWELELAALWAE